MNSTSVAYLKAHLSELLRLVKAGEELLVTDRGQPIARLVPWCPEGHDEALVEMARRGLVRLGTGPAPASLLERGPLARCRESVLNALLEERQEGP